MDIHTLQTFCLGLPGTEEDLKWEDNLCYCVGKKMYAVYDLSNGGLSLKTTPDLFEQLCQQAQIARAPYLGRYHWVRLEHLQALPADTLQNLITDSYNMVLAKLPRKLQRAVTGT